MPIFYAVEQPTYQPAMRNILSITQAYPAVVTTTFDGTNPGDHLYKTGLIVRLDIPKGYGMEQANLLYAPITVLSDSTFSIDIDTTAMDAFVAPAAPVTIGSGRFTKYPNPAQAVPIGKINEQLINAVKNVLPY